MLGCVIVKMIPDLFYELRDDSKSIPVQLVFKTWE